MAYLVNVDDAIEEVSHLFFSRSEVHLLYSIVLHSGIDSYGLCHKHRHIRDGGRVLQNRIYNRLSVHLQSSWYLELGVGPSLTLLPKIGAILSLVKKIVCCMCWEHGAVISILCDLAVNRKCIEN